MPNFKTKSLILTIFVGLVLFFCLFALRAYAATYPIGDLNHDGKVDVSDVLLCLRQATGLDPSTTEADINHDGIVDISDVMLIQRLAVGLNCLPFVLKVTPSSGSSVPNTAVTFTTTYSDPNGFQDIKYAYFLINTSTAGSNCFWGYYNRSTNKFYLRNDANTGWLGGYAPGSSYVIENSYVKLNCVSTSVSGSKDILTVKWSLTFKSAFTGSKNMYLYVLDNAAANSGWKQLGTWNISQVLSISINPKLWTIGTTDVNKVITMTQANKITVTNDGSAAETFSLNLINPAGWTAGTTAGNEIYVMSGLFCNTTDIPVATNFNQDASTEDILTTTSKKATSTIFGYSQGTANGVSVPSGTARALYLQFKSPTITARKEEQNISVVVSCQTP